LRGGGFFVSRAPDAIFASATAPSQIRRRLIGYWRAPANFTRLSARADIASEPVSTTKKSDEMRQAIRFSTLILAAPTPDRRRPDAGANPDPGGCHRHYEAAP